MANGGLKLLKSDFFLSGLWFSGPALVYFLAVYALYTFAHVVNLKAILYLVIFGVVFSFPWCALLYPLASITSTEGTMFYVLAAAIIIVGCHLNGYFFLSVVPRRQRETSNRWWFKPD